MATRGHVITDLLHFEWRISETPLPLNQAIERIGLTLLKVIVSVLFVPRELKCQVLDKQRKFGPCKCVEV